MRYLNLSIFILFFVSCGKSDEEPDHWYDPNMPWYKLTDETYDWLGFKEGTYWVYEDF